MRRHAPPKQTSSSRGYFIAAHTRWTVVIVEFLEKFTCFGLLRVGEFGKLLGHVTEFARHDRPAVGRAPFGDLMNRRALTDEPRPDRRFRRNVIVLLMCERFEVIRTGFDGSGFAITVRVRMIRLDETDVICLQNTISLFIFGPLKTLIQGSLQMKTPAALKQQGTSDNSSQTSGSLERAKTL